MIEMLKSVHFLEIGHIEESSLPSIYVLAMPFTFHFSPQRGGLIPRKEYAVCRQKDKTNNSASIITSSEALEMLTTLTELWILPL